MVKKYTRLHHNDCIINFTNVSLVHAIAHLECGEKKKIYLHYYRYIQKKKYNTISLVYFMVCKIRDIINSAK